MQRFRRPRVCMACALHCRVRSFNGARGSPRQMLIRYGYELEFFCPQPVLMVCLLDTHADHTQQVRWQGNFVSEPGFKTEIFRDVYGNDVRRFMAPAGKVTISRDQVFECDGLADPIVEDAKEVPLHEVPPELSDVPARQPLLRDRQAFQHRLEPVRQRAARLAPRAGDLRFRAPAPDLRLPARACRPAQPTRPTRSGSAFAAISRISPSRSAAA